MKAYVICSNDKIETVILNDEKKANKKMEELAKEDYIKKAYHFATYEDYQSIIYWHLHAVDCIK